ncbi:MAG: cellulose synthase, partial [Bacteroidota bacterium]
MRYLFSGVKVNNDIFGNDTQYFYDVILRKRNRFEAVFCCGAGSLHRREAVMDFALNKYELSIKKLLSKDSCIGTRANQNNKEIFKYLLETSFKPFAFHASEDFYTSILMHANYKSWKSIFHPKVECKMLSTQDVNSRSQQYQRYAEGTLDIALNKRVLFKKGLS